MQSVRWGQPATTNSGQAVPRGVDAGGLARDVLPLDRCPVQHTQANDVARRLCIGGCLVREGEVVRDDEVPLLPLQTGGGAGFV
jgi:hypothetical protein